MPQKTPPSNINDVHKEIISGLGNERERLDDALFNLEFYEADFSRFPPRAAGQSYDSQRYLRHVRLMRRIVDILTGNLYAEGPARKIQDADDVTAWLAEIYRVNDVDSLWQAADAMAAVTRAAAFRVLGTEDPDRPIEIELFDGGQFCVWCHPDRPCEPFAVATIDLFDQQRRIELWTSIDKTTYVTDKWEPGMPNAATLYKLLKPPEPNPYGVIPFSFVHWEKPIRCFWTGGLGSMLRELNDGFNFVATENFDSIRYNLRPVIKLRGVRAGWRPPKPIKPGDVWDLPSDDDEDPKGGDAEYLQADPSFISAAWEDGQNFLDLTLDTHGVPNGSIRMVSDVAKSGIAIVVEQAPLILWAKKRQRPFRHYECQLAKLVLTIGAKHLLAQDFDEYKVTGSKLAAVADRPNLVVHWPSMWPELPGPDRDESDAWKLGKGLTSLTKILMRRDGLSREEAEKELQEIAEDLKREQTLFEGLVAQPPASDPAADPQAEQDPELKGGNDDDPTDDEAEEDDDE